MAEELISPSKVRELMKSAISHMQKQGFDEARLHVELLLAHSLGWQRIQLYMNFDKSLKQSEIDEFRSLYERRLKHEPVQYIVGSTNFMGLTIKVDPRVLIPRPETETLVEQVMMECNDGPKEKKIHILEIGTGSGNIAIALAKFVKQAFITTIDNSTSALEVARLNMESHGVTGKVNLQEIDVFEPIDQLLLKRFDILVSNPPYVPLDEWMHLKAEVREFEPRDATTDSKDGLEFYRRLIEIAPYVLVEGGRVLFEIGDGQSPQVLRLMEEEGFFDVSVAPDLQGTNRVVKGRCRTKSRNPTRSN